MNNGFLILNPCGFFQSVDWKKVAFQFGFFVVLIGLVALFADIADAKRTFDDKSPFSKPLTGIRAVFSGPIAYTVSILGIMICGAALIFGGELSEVVKKVFMLVLAVAISAFAITFFDQFFGTASATIIIDNAYLFLNGSP